MARLERLYRRRVPTDEIITLELAKACSQLSHETRRQIGVLIDRQGHVHSVIIGTGQELVIPQLARTRSGLRLLRGVRLIHTHLNNQPLTQDDLTDLALLRLDLMVAIGVWKGWESRKCLLQRTFSHIRNQGSPAMNGLPVRFIPFSWIAETLFNL